MARNSMGKRPFKSADEYDAFTAWRKVYLYLKRPGAVKAVKARVNRRDRRATKQELRRMDFDEG